ADGRDQYDNSIGDVTGATTFSVAGGTCGGATCSATTVGSHTVTGTDSGKTGTATLTVTPAAVANVAVIVSPTSVTVGGTSTATATVTDQYGNTRAGDTVTFSATGASVGSVTNNGDGTYSVTVTA